MRTLRNWWLAVRAWYRYLVCATAGHEWYPAPRGFWCGRCEDYDWIRWGDDGSAESRQ